MTTKRGDQDDTIRRSTVEEPIIEEEDVMDTWMKRGDILRQLRQLELADQAARDDDDQDDDKHPSQVQENEIHVLPNQKCVLRYNSYLAHQRYYDDLKHVDCHYIDYGSIGNGNLVIEQDKSLGKGGLCWDAAFILAEYLMATEEEWNHPSRTTHVVDLGSGTGLCGLMLAKAVADCCVRVSDLPKLLPLMKRNVKRNFDPSHILLVHDSSVPSRGASEAADNDIDSDHDAEAMESLLFPLKEGSEGDVDPKKSRGSVLASVLEWGETYTQQQYDVVLGADVVASLYDPIALTHTIHNLCHASSVVFVSYKGRLEEPHVRFEAAMQDLFHELKRIRPTMSRNKNPNVFILKATGKKDTTTVGVAT